MFINYSNYDAKVQEQPAFLMRTVDRRNSFDLNILLGFFPTYEQMNIL